MAFVCSAPIQWNAAAVRRLLRKELNYPRRVAIIFCPGMGGNGHQDQAYTMWGNLHMRFDEWITFADAGGEFMDYDVKIGKKSHPAGKPELKRHKVEELKQLIIDRPTHASPVILLGFSAGAYLAMRVAMELEKEKSVAAGQLAVMAMGHVLFPEDRWEEASQIPGIVIIGQEEQKLQAKLTKFANNRTTGWMELDGGWKVNEWVDINPMEFDMEAMPTDACGGFAGKCAELVHIARTLPRCVVCTAGRSGHSIRHYERALRYGELFCVSGDRPPSNSSSSASSRSSSV